MNQIQGRLRDRCIIPITSDENNEIKKKSEKLRRGKGFDCPIDKEYVPLGNLDSVFNLKIRKEGELNTPPPIKEIKSPIKDENDIQIYSNKKNKKKESGYYAIKENINHSKKIMNNVKAGYSYFNYIPEHTIEEEIKFASQLCPKPKVVKQPIIVFFEIIYRDHIKRI